MSAKCRAEYLDCEGMIDRCNLEPGHAGLHGDPPVDPVAFWANLRKQAAPAPAPFMTTQELVARTGLSRKSVYQGAAAGEIPCRRVGRRFVFVRAVIEEWLRCDRAHAPCILKATGTGP